MSQRGKAGALHTVANVAASCVVINVFVLQQLKQSQFYQCSAAEPSTEIRTIARG